MLTRINKLFQKRAFKNGVWMYLLQFFNAVIPFVTIPYITRILGTEKYGIFNVALNLVLYMQVIVEYGFGMSATRKVALQTNENLNKLFSSVLLSRLALLVGCVLFAIGYCYLYREDSERCLSIWILMICLIGYCFQSNWFFQGIQEMKTISIINIVARTTSLIFIFLFVHSAADLLLYCFLYAASPLLSGVLGFLIAAIRYNLHVIRISVNDIINEIKDGFYVFTTQLSSKVFGSVGITILGIFAPYSEVGIFSAIQKIANILLLAWTPITQVLYPISSKHMNADFFDGKKFVFKIRKYVLPVFLALAIIVAFFARPIIVMLFGAEYESRYYWTVPLLVWLIIAINNNFLGIQVLLGSGHDKEYSKCFQLGVICTIAINFVLIFFFHGDGAAIAPACSELVLGVALTREIRKIEKTLITETKEFGH